MVDNSLVKVLVVDDDSLFLELIELYLQKIGISKIATADSYLKAKNKLLTFFPDLVVLDIDLGGGKNGIDFGYEVRASMPDAAIVFLTSHYTDSVFESVKPLRPSAFLDKELSELKVRQAVELALVFEADLSTPKPEFPICHIAKEFIFVKVGAAFKKIELEEIDYIYYADRYSNIQVDGKSYPLNVTMRELAQNLSTHLFMQIHQSYIINVNKITHISTANNQIEVVGKWLPIGVSFRKLILEKLKFLT